MKRFNKKKAKKTAPVPDISKDLMQIANGFVDRFFCMQAQALDMFSQDSEDEQSKPE